MTPEKWFDDVPVIGRMNPVQAGKKLRELGTLDIPDEPPPDEEDEKTSALGGWRNWWSTKLWRHTGHAFGYIAPGASDQIVSIRHAGSIKADNSLKNARLKITLDRLRIAEYPGGGTHHVLFDFYAQTQIAGNLEHLHFNATFRGREGEHAALVGYPLFVGLEAGPEGVAFKCFTVNVKNDQDESLLGFLDSDVFKAGLRLVTTAQPALAPLSMMASGLARGLAQRNRNVAVQDFYMGLDFSNISTRARLAEGSYLAVQIPEADQTSWDWGLWKYNPISGAVVSASDPKQPLRFNYVVFGVSKMDGDSGQIQSATPQKPR
ncbi:MAG: hypothetical protein K8U57_08720 [Planctomycetes bacterium]|nr:hypothetical protein [Planctomycetota bacterium]